MEGTILSLPHGYEVLCGLDAEELCQLARDLTELADAVKANTK
jgi:hypothetical protein